MLANLYGSSDHSLCCQVEPSDAGTAQHAHTSLADLTQTIIYTLRREGKGGEGMGVQGRGGEGKGRGVEGKGRGVERKGRGVERKGKRGVMD